MKKIPLTQGKFALVDDEDFDRLSLFKWCVQKNGRRFSAVHTVWGKPKSRRIFMHREVIDAPKGLGVDHIDGDGLNNCRANLRLATCMENSRGARLKKVGASSQFRGVSWNSQSQKWKAVIIHSKELVHLGYFRSELGAARAYDAATRKYFGEFATPNFP